MAVEGVNPRVAAPWLERIAVDRVAQVGYLNVVPVPEPGVLRHPSLPRE
jgi:hypothetical protein